MNKITNQLTLENSVAGIVAFFIFLFSMWTLGHHAATFLHIPWASLSKGLMFSGVFIVFAAYRGACCFSASYSFEVRNNLRPCPTTNIPIFLFFLTSIVLILTSSEYSFTFCISLAFFSVIWWLTEKHPIKPSNDATSKQSNKHNRGIELTFFLTLVIIAVIVTLTTHRSDLDDSSFLQMASQTLLHQDRAPLTFDTSLGAVMEKFRFAPYRVTSYETAIALITEWTGINILTVYYLVIPGITAGLTVCVAYLFTRWFLPSSMAILATGIFLLLMFAWGDSHFAYGSRVFVRLFQGKGLLIALTTPITIIAGLMLLRRHTPINVISLALSQITAIGVSSSGLVLTFFTSMLLMMVGIQRDTKAVFYSCSRITVTLIYPAILAFWLKFQNESAIPLNEVGTYLPINASLGFGLHGAIAFCAFIIGFFTLAHGRQRREYGLMVLGTFLFILNPWFSDILSTVSAKNMSWRLAWASPVPLIMSIGFAASIGAWPQNKIIIQKIASIGSSLIGATLLILFLVTAKWAVAPENNVKWSFPTANLAPEYYSAKEIVNELKTLNLKGSILSSHDIAAWLPLLAPDLKLVMPGHTYPIMLRTVLSVSDFNARMQLFNAVNTEKPNLSSLTELIRKYQVTTIITPQAVSATDILPLNGLPLDLSIKEVRSTAGYKIFAISYDTHNR